MFRVKENKSFENSEMDYPFHIELDGKIVEGIGAKETTVFNELGEQGNGYEIEAFDKLSRFLGDFVIDDFDEISKISLFGWKFYDDFQLNIIIHCNYGYDSYFVDFQIIPNFSFWKKEFSFAEYSELFHEILLEVDQKWGFTPSNNPLTEFTEIELTVSHTFDNKVIREELSDYETILFDVHRKTVKHLKKEGIIASINATFDFPEEVKISCKQYLQYFARFLQDLGIKNTSDVKEEAGKILFSVTPIDDVEALDKIREALAVYLNLPASPIVYDDSFAAMRLQQQIENLQHSQRMAVRELQFNEKLLTAQSDALREKNVTISQQQSVIEQQNKIIEVISSKSIMMDSVENKEELEELYDGLKIGESKFLKEQLGIHFNPAKVIKTAVKNTFGKEIGQISILEMSEKTGEKDN